MKAALPVLFLLVSLVHLAGRFAGWRRVPLVTKPLLMPLLLGCYLLRAEAVSPAVVCALVCGFLGDLAMMVPVPEGPMVRPRPALLAGLGAFFLGHGSYLAAFLLSARTWPPAWCIVLTVVLSVGLFVLVFCALRPHMGAMMVPGTAYLIILVSMACLAAMTGVAAGAPCRAAGGLLFVLSDYILARGILLGERRLTHLYVMLTYLSAQALLVVSLL